MAAPTKEQHQAAQQFVDQVIAALKNDRGVHAETTIAATARMAGTFLFRSFAFPLSSVAPGQAVFSDAANEQGPKLVQILGSVLAYLGVNLDQSKLGEKQTPEHSHTLSSLLLKGCWNHCSLVPRMPLGSRMLLRPSQRPLLPHCLSKSAFQCWIRMLRSALPPMDSSRVQKQLQTPWCSNKLRYNCSFKVDGSAAAQFQC